MKKYLFVIVALVMVSCTDQMMEKEMVGEYAEQQTPASEVTALIEKARWGDGQAYLQLTNCYRDGKGVKQDFINMVGMMFFAKEYGGIKRINDYMTSLPDDSEYRLVYDALDKSCSKADETLEVAEKLIARDCVEGYTVKGIVLMENDDMEEGRRLLRYATERGSGLAQLYLCMPGWQKEFEPDIDKLKELADSLPLASMCLGNIYSGQKGDDEKFKDDQLAAYYYMKADKHALLGRDGARWLLAYHQNGGTVNLTDKDIERLKKLAWMGRMEPDIIEQNDLYQQGDDEDDDEYDYVIVEAVDTIEVE